MQLVYYAPPKCFLRRKIEAAANAAGFHIKREDLDACDTSQVAFPRYPSMKTPFGVVPGSNPSMQFIANAAPISELYGRTLMDRAQVDSHLQVILAELETPIYGFVLGAPKEKVQKDLAATFSQFDAIYAHQTYLVGDRLTIADLAIAGAVAGALDKNIWSTEELAKYTSLGRLFNTISGREQWGYELPISADKAGKSTKQAKDESATKAAAPAPKKDAEAAKPKAVPPSSAPKVKDPIEELPPTEFDMDAWKRCYSNAKDLKAEAMPYLWEHLDRAGFSFWHFEYIRFGDDDNKKVFMASNLLGMYLQRVDNWLRKYMFGVCDVFEEKDFFGVEGILMVRGQEVPKRLVEHDQYESFKWTKLDVEKDKKYIEDFFCNEEEVNGKKIADCKVYK